MGLQAQLCVIPGQIVVVPRVPDPEPSHREPLRGDISGLLPFLNFFHEGTLKNFSGVSKRRLVLFVFNLCRRRPWFNASCRCVKLDRTLKRRGFSTTKLRDFY